MDILSRLQSEFGDAVWPRVAQETDAVDGVHPQAIAAPQDEAAAQALVHWCGRENIAFVPRGGGTKLHIGAPPSRCDLIISTEKLTQIFDHDEGNATVQAGAGIQLENLDQKMQARGQYFPHIGGFHSYPTLGGVVATNEHHGIRYVAPRDLVVGLNAVLSDGRLVKAGSKVVKNVSGYDLNKLFIGSFGTLGLITEVTVRLRPMPAQRSMWQHSFENWTESESLAWAIVNGSFEPNTLGVHWSETISTKLNYTTSAMFEGGTAAVQSQLDKLPESNIVWTRGYYRSPWRLRAHFPLHLAPQWAQEAQSLGAKEVSWNSLSGHVVAFFDETCDVHALRAEAEKLGGFLVVEQAPIEMKTPELVWGKPRGDFALMKKLKQSFDAANVCAPGRFIGGL